MNSKIPILRSALVLSVAVTFAGCQDESIPSQPNSPTMPGPSPALVDASTSSEVDGFFWQPPIVKDALGENNRDLSPVVVVCRAEDIRDEKFCNDSDSEPADANALATLPAELSDEEEDRYEAVFQSDEFPSLEVGDILRVLAFRGDPLSGEEPAGWFDAELTDPDTKTKGNKQLVGEGEDTRLELQLGSALPATFRMSDALFCSQENIDDGYCFVGTFSNDEGGSGSSENSFIALDVDPDFIPDEKVEAGVDEVTFILERVERSDEPGEGCLDGVDDPFPLQERDLCVRGATVPDMMELPFKADANGDSRVTLGMCFDGSGLTEDEEEQFQGWDADEVEGSPFLVRTPLRGQPAPSELNCTGFVAAALDDGPVTRLARAGWQSVKDLFVPPAVALTTGAGHSVMTFSRIVYARSLVVADVSGDLEAAPSAAVDVSVRVTRPPTTSTEDHFDSEAVTPSSDYPDDDNLFDDGGDGPLDEAIAAATVGVNGIDLDVGGFEVSAPATVTTTTVDGVDGIATFEVTMPAEPTNETVTVIVEGPALGTPVTIPIDVVQAPVIENLAPSTTLADDVDFIFNGSGDGENQLSILFDATDPDNNINSVVVEAVNANNNTFDLLDDASGGSKVVDPNLDGGEFDPADGEYTTTITVTDDDGLQATESIQYTLDTTGPQITSVEDDAPGESSASTETVTITGDITDANGISNALVQLLPDADTDCALFDGQSQSEDVTTDVQADGQFTATFSVDNPGGADAEVGYCVQVTSDDVAQGNGAGGFLKNTANRNEDRGSRFTILWNPSQ